MSRNPRSQRLEVYGIQGPRCEQSENPALSLPDGGRLLFHRTVLKAPHPLAHAGEPLMLWFSKPSK